MTYRRPRTRRNNNRTRSPRSNRNAYPPCRHDRRTLIENAVLIACLALTVWTPIVIGILILWR